MRKIRNRSNYYSGYFVCVFVSAITILVGDPLGVVHGGLMLDLHGSLLVTGIAALFAELAYALFSKPYVSVQSGTLVIQNPFRRWRISEPVEIVEGFAYHSAITSRRRIRIAASEISNLSRMVGSSRMRDQLDESTKAASTTGGGVACSWTLFDAFQYAVLAVWIVYVIMGLRVNAGM